MRTNCLNRFTVGPRTLRLAALVTLPALLLAAAAPSSFADSPVFVDDDGLCGGNAPCFTTIQAGVNNATDPDAALSGAAAEVIVYPGNYAEGIDLSTMGSAGAGAPGDIDLFAQDPNDRPILSPVANTGIFTFAAFPGDVTIDGFIVSAGSLAGVSLGNVAGAVTIRNLTAESTLNTCINISGIMGAVTIEHVDGDLNGTAGIIVFSSDDIDIFNCRVNGIFGGFGLIAFTNGGAITVNLVTADNNDSGGMDLAASGPVTIETSSGSGNSGRGINISNAASVAIAVTNADNNGFNQSGFDITSSGDVLLTRCSADGNASRGISISQATGVTITDTHADGNVLTGMDITTSGDADVGPGSAGSNMNGNGVFISAQGAVTITDFDANDNGSNGLDITAAAAIVVDDVGANLNGGYGMALNSQTQTTVSDAIAGDNGIDGIFVTGNGPVTIDPTSASDNDESGINIVVDGDVTLLDIDARRNMEYGIRVSSTGRVDIQRSVASENMSFAGIGVFSAPLGLDIAETTSEGNNGYGFLITGSGIGNTHLIRATAFNNAFVGIWVAVGAFDIVLDAVYVAENMNDGVALSGLPGSDYRVNGSILCANAGAGLVLESAIDVNAEGNWWGDPSGPTHTNNPGATGDHVIDSLSGGGMGLADFSPWIDTLVTNIVPQPVIVGEPTQVSLRLSDAAQTLVLGEGPGARSTPAPFAISTTNGVLTNEFGTAMQLPAFVNNPGGLLTANWTPGAPGPVTLRYEFCGYQVTHALAVHLDCNDNGIPDSAELIDNDCNENLVPDDCEPDCNDNGVADDCDLGLLTKPIIVDDLLPIPDNDPAGVTTVVNVAENGTIADLDVGLKIDHTWNGDLEVVLFHAAMGVTLIDRPGRTTSGFGFDDDGFDIVLDDDAPLAIETFDGDGNKVYGRYRPNSPLAAFNGFDKFGSWTLFVADHVGSDIGTLLQWTLFIVNDTGIALSTDCNDNRIPDECEPDCNGNGVADECDITAGTSQDVNGNGVPDECDPDCNGNAVPDDLDVQLIGPAVAIPIDLMPDQTISDTMPAQDTFLMNGTGIIFDVRVGVDLAHTWVGDLQIRISHLGTTVLLWNNQCGNEDDMQVRFPDGAPPVVCGSPVAGDYAPFEPLAAFNGLDRGGDWTLEVIDTTPGDSGSLDGWSLFVAFDGTSASPDCNANGVPDECEPDCNNNGVADECDVDAATSEDCNGNAVPDECELFTDCNNNGLPDPCEGLPDCNGDNIPDECDGGCPPGQEQPMDDMTTDFMTDNAQGHPCGDCGKMDPLWFLLSLCGYVGVLFIRRRR